MASIAARRTRAGLGVIGAVLVGVGCHARPPARLALPPPEARVAAAMAAWGHALERGDDAALARTEDRAGRAALLYVAVKAAASHVDGGAEAVELTVIGTVAMLVLRGLWPGPDPAEDTVVLVVPTGALGPALVDAGLAGRTAPDGPAVVVAEVPWSQSVARLEAASARHRARLRAQAAWTCRPVRIERTVLPSEPSLARGAGLSPHVFGGWLDDTDAAWLVRADCAGGPGAFVVTGHVDPRDGATHDQVLIAALAAPAAR